MNQITRGLYKHRANNRLCVFINPRTHGDSGFYDIYSMTAPEAGAKAHHNSMIKYYTLVTPCESIELAEKVMEYL